eukprot:CAMPEP_0118689312 /NCGR_PEP_ID=MMETSP0800-20121206/9421_1 /TAXON_ID=210618 ORGANISM="Striatella unipunctata, Strain CCMP2910" /NCGR_SAMPLE_ID=MMETSP0800 /ASSEMBLY_ACC=CAM_ASM_000638 /LENGTH=309 /DNA_ID=CAMNT_0006586699 /DNA_START=37 /DNA_END=965 /DNA_ORIENTATION=+
MVMLGPLFLTPHGEEHLWCPDYDLVMAEMEVMGKTSSDSSSSAGHTGVYENPDYITDPCRYMRIPKLFFLTIEECDLSRRLLASVLTGGAVGVGKMTLYDQHYILYIQTTTRYERRAADRPAGIRTMSLVSLGACFFTISSQLAFKSSTQTWDASRVTAAIPSGVGFLGAGLVWKGTVTVGPKQGHQVHGLTTAASLWLSAAMGVGCGGALYFVTIYSTVLVIVVLRYLPRVYLRDDPGESNDDQIGSPADETEEDDVDADNQESDSGFDDDDDSGGGEAEAPMFQTERTRRQRPMPKTPTRSHRGLFD